MRTIRIAVAVALLGALGTGAFAQPQADERLFEEAKILIFDKKWDAAQDKLEELLGREPEASIRDAALFYRAKCLAGRGGRDPEALEAYRAFLRDVRPGGRNSGFLEDAEVSLLDLAYGLYEKGDKGKLALVADRLRNPNKVVRYYAAFKLSYVKDKDVAGRSVPVLKELLDEERDTELRDRARIALLRVDPGALRGVEEERHGARARVLKLQVVEGGRKKLDISIPWALADLAIQAIPDEEKSVMRRKGYDIDRIINELAKSGSSILEIADEGSVIRIWIE